MRIFYFISVAMKTKKYIGDKIKIQGINNDPINIHLIHYKIKEL